MKKETKMKTETTKFQTPHEQAQATKANKGKKKSAKPAPVANKVERDAWNALADSRMAKINAVVIAAGKAGVTTAEVAAKSKEAPGLVSAQLSWHVGKGNCTRKEEVVDGKKVSRWTVVYGAEVN